MRVLVVEDEPYMAEAIRDGLRLEAIAADLAGDGDAALELLSVNTYDIAVLDRDIPGPTGDEIAASIVASGGGMPILMLTAADRLDDKASGFALGADDYLTKPFDLRELVLRLRALDRRRANHRPPVQEIAGLRLDAFRREVYRDGRYVALTRKQFAVLDPRPCRGRGHQRRNVAGTSLGRACRPVHQCRAHHRLGPAQAARRALADRHGARGRISHRPVRAMSDGTVTRAPGMSVRLKLTLSYAGFLMIAGVALLAVVWVYLLRYVPDVAMTEIGVPNRSDLLDAFVPRAIAVLVGLLGVGLIGGWMLAGRMLAPLTRITDATRMAANGSLGHRIRLPGREDEFRELADAFDGMLARLEAQVEEQRRFAANASHELRTPLAITQTLLDVARDDPDRDADELVDRLHVVNDRAIALTEALLLLSRADRRSFTRDAVDLSLLAEDATETLLPLAERHGVTLETSGDVAPTVGSAALLLQLTTNLVHNAIVHNLPEGGSVRVETAARPESVTLTVENTGESLSPLLVSTLTEPFQRGTERIRGDHAGVGLGLAIAQSITRAHDGTLTLAPRPAGGLRITAQFPAMVRDPNGRGRDTAMSPFGGKRTLSE